AVAAGDRGGEGPGDAAGDGIGVRREGAELPPGVGDLVAGPCQVSAAPAAQELGAVRLREEDLDELRSGEAAAGPGLLGDAPGAQPLIGAGRRPVHELLPGPGLGGPVYAEGLYQSMKLLKPW